MFTIITMGTLLKINEFQIALNEIFFFCVIYILQCYIYRESGEM